jgi:subtilase family serine protease
LNAAVAHQPASASSARRTASAVRPADDFPYYGWWPSDVQAAYALPTDKRAGAGMTVAVVDAFDAPTAEADLAVYRSFFNLPPCTTQNGCFKKVNARGQQGQYPPSGAGTGWTIEVALDLDAVSATCANCKIVLVESDSDYVNDLAAAAGTAGKLAAIVSNSYYAPEVDPQPSPGEAPMTTYVPSYRRNGVVYVAGTGDWGYEAEGIWGVQADGDSPFPAGIPDVVAVGGTILSNASGGWTETAAGFAGGGCSTIFPKPPWQQQIACPNRMTADVAATADGLSIYDSLDFGGWGDIGGTSASTALVAGVYALARDVGPLTVANLYLHPNALHDITTGDPTGTCPVSYFCNARPGYDGPTGMGTPNGTRAFQDLF